MEHEITARGPLLDANGALREPGFARSLLLDYDRSAIKAPAFRVKEWDYYCVVSEDIALAFTIADNGYMGLLSVSALDLAKGGEVTESPMTAFPMGKTRLPASSAKGVSEAKAGGLALRFEAKDGVRTVRASWPGFGSTAREKAEGLFGKGPDPRGKGIGFEAELVLREQVPRESMVIATPFAGKPRHFYYNQKINCQDAEGRARVGSREFRLEPGKAFGVLDWGRGVWPYGNAWLWGSASGLARLEGSAAPVPFGFNIGYGFGDTSAAGENMVFVEGRAHKIGRLTIELDDRDFLAPWKVRSEDGRLDLTLEPLLDRAASSDILIIASIQHQVFGKWRGSVALEDGRRIEVRDLVGFCEKVRNRW